jgi:hypothetical protein
MACRISELVLKCRDPWVLARFWCKVLDFIELDREAEECIDVIGHHRGTLSGGRRVGWRCRSGCRGT